MVYAFSDGNPLVEYLVFFVVLSASTALFYFGKPLRVVEGATHCIAEFTRRRQALTEHGLTADLRRIDLFRIIVGGLATFRYGKILAISMLSGDLWTIGLTATATILAVCITVGFMTPLAVFVLMSASNLIFDNYLGASTLGTMVMSICLLVILLAPGGLTLSVDALLVRTKIPGNIIRILRHIVGNPNEDRLLVAKLCGLFAYFCICLYSVAWHTTDDAWTSGLVISWVMLSPIANPNYFEHMWDFYNGFPWSFVALGKIAIAGMFVWYVLTLPAIFMGRWIRLFMIIWGLLFFLISALVLPLQYLGWYELAFWFMLFACGKPFGSRSGPELAILFDDRCNLCDRTVKTLARVDIFGRLEFRPIRRNIEFATANGVSLQQGLADLVGVDLTAGERVSGFTLYYSLTGRVFLLWPFRPLFWLGVVTGIGPVVYRYIADRRTKLFGVCEFSNIPDRYMRPALSSELMGTEKATPIFHGMVTTLIVLAAAFLVRLPIASTDPDSRHHAYLSKSVFGASPAAFGIHKINVFNSQDIALFRFGSAIGLLPDGINLTSPSGIIEHTPHTLVADFSDAETYFLTSHMRRMSRVNFGCDRDFAIATLPTYASVYRLPTGDVPTQDVVLEFRIAAWPSANDLKTYSGLQFQTWPLCRYRLNLTDGKLKEFVFIQSGLNEAVRQKGFPAVLNAKHGEVASNFPCRYAAAFANIIAGPQPVDEKGQKFTEGLKALPADVFGRYPADCLLDTWKLVNDRLDLFTGANLDINEDNCALGVEFLRLLQLSASTDTVLSSQIARDWEHSKMAAGERNFEECLQAAFGGWNTYWSTVTEMQVSLTE